MHADVVATWEDAAAMERAPLVVVEPLEDYLDASALGAGPLTVSPIGDGHSNATFAVRRAGCTLVLRRAPRPPLPPSAHDVLREARLLRALAGRLPVPNVVSVCEDAELIGAPFYLMEHVDGAVLTTALLPGLHEL
jgi:aminoglycoside phosphotransferase (APT) family kinase protein